MCIGTNREGKQSRTREPIISCFSASCVSSPALHVRIQSLHGRTLGLQVFLGILGNGLLHTGKPGTAQGIQSELGISLTAAMSQSADPIMVAVPAAAVTSPTTAAPSIVALPLRAVTSSALPAVATLPPTEPASMSIVPEAVTPLLMTPFCRSAPYRMM